MTHTFSFYTSSPLHAGLPASVRKISAVRRELLQMPTLHWPTLQHRLCLPGGVETEQLFSNSPRARLVPAHPTTPKMPPSALSCHSCFRLYWSIPNNIVLCCFSPLLKQKTPIPLSWPRFPCQLLLISLLLFAAKHLKNFLYLTSPVLFSSLRSITHHARETALVTVTKSFALPVFLCLEYIVPDFCVASL